MKVNKKYNKINIAIMVLIVLFIICVWALTKIISNFDYTEGGIVLKKYEEQRIVDFEMSGGFPLNYVIYSKYDFSENKESFNDLLENIKKNNIWIEKNEEKHGEDMNDYSLVNIAIDKVNMDLEQYSDVEKSQYLFFEKGYFYLLDHRENLATSGVNSFTLICIDEDKFCMYYGKIKY